MLAVKDRTNVYVDGFNLYHGIKDFGEPALKWLDIASLCTRYVPNQKLQDIYYFSALAHHTTESQVNRHRAYIAALKATGITVIEGRFKEKWLTCTHCGQAYKSHEEKETDVNIAISVVEHAILKECETIVVVSGDTDILPALKRAKAHGAYVNVLFPPHRKNEDLRVFCDDSSTLNRRQLRQCLLPDTVHIGNGEIHRPPRWL